VGSVLIKQGSNERETASSGGLHNVTKSAGSPRPRGARGQVRGNRKRGRRTKSQWSTLKQQRNRPTGPPVGGRVIRTIPSIAQSLFVGPKSVRPPKRNSARLLIRPAMVGRRGAKEVPKRVSRTNHGSRLTKKVGGWKNCTPPLDGEGGGRQLQPDKQVLKKATYILW